MCVVTVQLMLITDTETWRIVFFFFPGMARGLMVLHPVSSYLIYRKSRFKFLLPPSADLTTDPMDPPPVFFNASPGSSAADVRRAGYGSLSDTPSIISVPPCLSPPPSAMPFPPLFVSSRSLRTISAKDLERSCIWYRVPKLDLWMTVRKK